ncbi:2-oxo-4-hydroxy-4-carboxy-5-ureidoimidazoline decarboxylase [Enterovibrio nigricans]|uniref:2-oxo-4-hydroxy-4-carboxy-5-ureidoimidazoline decarboxylase n=1 Tax=Enterovibrio nigricans DSM 22720 TaxID=1121868 RepID=A0A1T4VGJ7_9GAMM|nr:2-oxo-4-hydroxy-4-carboxy-5-ureidoimidazoline decarboxylase [Enterovibrio nigricans]PKF49416.1 OHCU decarboxylase [Enterovibrio nigricans]SKA64077.1 OHCU decarboxylase [Enterovibrio nigricans DSM 22720]
MALFSTCRPSEQTKDQFIETFGGVYEHSPWVAETAFGNGLDAAFDDQDTLHLRMSNVLNEADDAKKMQVVLAHPDLAGRAAQLGELTAESTTEQASAGIDECTPEEFARFTEYNHRYKAKFQFPFIMAVKGANRHLILSAFETRLENDLTTEFDTAIGEINKIALFRLRDL